MIILSTFEGLKFNVDRRRPCDATFGGSGIGGRREQLIFWGKAAAYVTVHIVK